MPRAFSRYLREVLNLVVILTSNQDHIDLDGRKASGLSSVEALHDLRVRTRSSSYRVHSIGAQRVQRDVKTLDSRVTECMRLLSQEDCVSRQRKVLNFGDCRDHTNKIRKIPSH
jgi:hypothetical protein